MIQIEITTHCNAKCIYCFKQMISEDYHQSMSLKVFKEIVDFIPWKNNRWLLQGSGEPLLCPDLYDMCEYVYNKDPDSIIEIITNGSLIDEKVFYKLINHHINRISISVDGISEDYERYRIGIKWSKILELLKVIKKYKETNQKTIPIGIAMVLMKSNLEKLIDFIEFMSDYSIDFISINALQDAFNNLQDETLENVDTLKVLKVFNDAKAVANANNMKVYFPLIGKKIISSFSERCTFSVKSLYISVDGKLDPCCMLSRHGLWGDIQNAEYSKIDLFNMQWEKADYPDICAQCIKNGVAFIGK